MTLHKLSRSTHVATTRHDGSDFLPPPLARSNIINFYMNTECWLWLVLTLNNARPMAFITSLLSAIKQ